MQKTPITDISSQSPETLYYLKEVSFYYDTGRKALESISLKIKTKEKILLLGPNGAGKSTLLQIMAGLISPQTGDVFLKRIPLFQYPENTLRKRVGFLFQNAEDQLVMPTVIEDVMFSLLNAGLEPDIARKKAESAIRLCGLEGLEERETTKLSAGEKKKAALAGLLCLEPEILLLDEPTAGLDLSGKKNIISFLSKLNCSMVIATHDIDAGLYLAKHVVVLNKKIHFDGPVQELLDNEKLLIQNNLEIPAFLKVFKAGIESLRQDKAVEDLSISSNNTNLPTTPEEAATKLKEAIVSVLK
ncbi:MAG: ABC transporter ATP-binding protein [Thermoplasmata archaeon]